MQVFSSLLALVALAGAALVLLAGLLARRVPLARTVWDAFAPFGWWLAFVVAAGSTLGSLYFSEVAGFTPCTLCWYQRIAMYPLTALTLVAAIRKDRDAVWYVVPIAAIGALIAGYHALIEWRPSLDSGVCSATGPACTDVWFREFGFVTLAFMAWCGFLAIVVFAFAARQSPHRTETP